MAILTFYDNPKTQTRQELCGWLMASYQGNTCVVDVDRGKSHTDLLQNNVAINSGWACHLDRSDKIMTSSPHPNSLEHCMADILCTYFGRGFFEFARSVCTEYQVFRRSWIHFTKFDSTLSRWPEMGKKMMPNATSRSPTSKRRSLLKSFVSSRETFTRSRDSNFLPSPTVHGATKQRDILLFVACLTCRRSSPSGWAICSQVSNASV